MTITFVLPMAGIAGGVKVVYEYANRLQARGHTVRIVVPRHMFPKQSFSWRVEAKARQVKYRLDALRGKSEAQWFDLHVPLLRTPSLEPAYIPDGDVIIATHYTTAECIAPLPTRCGTKFYFLQDYEIWDGDVARVDATWKLPLKKIVIAPFLKERGEKMGERIYGMIPNAINPQEFYNPHKKYHQPRRILMMSHHRESKGMRDGFAAMATVRQAFPDTQLTMFGAYPALHDMPEGTPYFQSPSSNELRQLYCDADIFVFPSWAEGWGLPPMEAMACKTAVVTTNVGGVPLFTNHGQAALVVEPRQPQQLADAILRLLKDPSLLKQISEAGYQAVQAFTWDASTDLFESILQREGHTA